MNEEIKKLIEEEAEKHIGRNVVFGCAPIETHEGFRKKAFIDGASFILHQNRWRKVEDELPELKINEFTDVLVKNSSGDISLFSIITIADIDTIKNNYAEWKPIS